MQAINDAWNQSSRRQPCVICGRDCDGDCRVKADGSQAICHYGSRFAPPPGLKPGDVVPGKDGQRWAFTGDIGDGRAAHFTLDKPREATPHRATSTGPARKAAAASAPVLARLPEPGNEPPPHLKEGTVLAYSVADGKATQWTVEKGTGKNKRPIPHHVNAAGDVEAKAGPDPWPLWKEEEALQHGRGKWITEAEGPKCAGWFRAGGLVSVSQPGHAHSAAAIEARYRRLKEAGVLGVAYLADHDKTGKAKAERCAAAAAAAGLGFRVIHAVDLWPGVPAGGSIDDAPGTAAERCDAFVEALQKPEPEPGKVVALDKAKEARRQQQAAENAPFRVLGWCADRARIFYQECNTGQIGSIKPTAAAGPLLHLALSSWWEMYFPGARTGVDWVAACSSVIEQANRAGVFAPERVRGRGLWMDGDAVVWHLGDRLEINGKEMPLIEHRSANHYPRLPALDIDRAVAPLTDDEGREILKAVSAMGWSSPLDPLHLLGWIITATVGGALDKRPCLQVTSRFGSGKTYTRENVLQPLLAGLAISRSNSSEAGIRQTLKTDTLPVLIDESEGEDHSRREGHLRLARLSYDGSPTDRGTTHGQALSYAIRSSVAMLGINSTINNPAERSRTVVVGREQLPQAEWSEVDRRLRALLTAEAGARLLRRTVNHLPTLRKNAATFRRAVEAQLAGTGAARAGDTYGALLAGAHLLTSVALVDDSEAVAWLDSIHWTAAAALGETGSDSQDGIAESLQCLAHLLAHEEPWRSDTGTGRISVRELIDLARLPSGADEAEQARKALGRRGIRAGEPGLLIANAAEPLAPIYGRTKWRDGGHRARLLDLPGAYAAGKIRFTAHGSERACCVPWDALT